MKNIGSNVKKTLKPQKKKSIKNILILVDYN